MLFICNKYVYEISFNVNQNEIKGFIENFMLHWK